MTTREPDTTPDATVGVVVRPPWLPDGLYQIWLQYYMDAGGQAGGQNAEIAAIEQTRQDSAYESYFPGIKRDDGTIRYADNPEQTYYTNIESYRNTIEGLRMQPDSFGEEYIDLIEGDVSPNEFSTRVNALQDRVLSQGPAIRDWYAENYGLDLTPQGILAGLMSERVNDAILNRQITMAEIAGEGGVAGYDISAEFANMLATEGNMERNEANRLFGSARQLLPMLGALAARHGDPDDTFDLVEFTDAFLNDPEQAQRIERLRAQESSTFTGGAQLEYLRDRATGGVGGLAVSG